MKRAKRILKNLFRTTNNCEQIAKLEQKFCPKVCVCVCVWGGGGGGAQNPLVPLTHFWRRGARVPPPPTTTPFFYASANLSCLVFFIGTSFPNLFPLKIMTDSSFWAFSTNSIYLKSNFCQRCQFWVQVHFWLNNVSINDISDIHVAAHWWAGSLNKLDLRSGSNAIDIS